MDDSCHEAPMPGTFSGKAEFLAERERNRISFSRRKELLHYAEKLAEDISGQVKPNELCLLRNFVSSLLERE